MPRHVARKCAPTARRDASPYPFPDEKSFRRDSWSELARFYGSRHFSADQGSVGHHISADVGNFRRSELCRNLAISTDSGSVPCRGVEASATLPRRVFGAGPNAFSMLRRVLRRMLPWRAAKAPGHPPAMILVSSGEASTASKPKLHGCSDGASLAREARVEVLN